MDKTGRKSRPEPLAKLLEEVLATTGLGERLRERRVIAAWPEIVGDEIAEHVRAVDIADGELLVSAAHGAWRQEITLLAPQIIDRFNTLFGEDTVRELRWHRGLTDRRRPDKRE